MKNVANAVSCCFLLQNTLRKGIFRHRSPWPEILSQKPVAHKKNNNSSVTEHWTTNERQSSLTEHKIMIIEEIQIKKPKKTNK